MVVGGYLTEGVAGVLGIDDVRGKVDVHDVGGDDGIAVGELGMAPDDAVQPAGTDIPLL